MTATTRLVRDGRCTLAELKELGGWMKSSNQLTKPVYFTYCGGMNLAHRIYLDASTGRIYQ